MKHNANYEENAHEIVNYKLIDNKYFIKHKLLEKTIFADIFLSTLKEDESMVYACKQISKLYFFQRIRDFNYNHITIETILANLKKQIHIWKQFDHCNVVKLINFSETKNNLYFFLEYCNGRNLYQVIRDKGQLSEAESIAILQQILDGLSYLYENKYFLLELKPDNILMHNGVVKLDYSDVRAYEIDKRSFVLQDSPQYMAPQILLGDNYCRKCDMWSIGVILYQMLFGVFPWKETYNIFTLFTAINSQKIQFPNTNPVSDGMKEIILMMLQVKEEDRCSIFEVQEKLKKMQN